MKNGKLQGMETPKEGACRRKNGQEFILKSGNSR